MIDVNQYRWLRLEPVDAWFFRDGRPSNQREDQSDLESEFPPNPGTVVGAIRAALARTHGWNGRGCWASDANLKSILGDGFDDLGQLSFLGPLLMEENEILWPMPRHVVGQRVNNRFVPVGFLEPSDEPLLTDAGSLRMPQRKKSAAPLVRPESPEPEGKPPQPASGVFVTTAGMSKILAGQLPDLDDCRGRDELFRLESRVGILRDQTTRTTGQNAMYSPRYVRLTRGVSLAVGVAGLPDHWHVPSLVPLGGESRMAGIERLNQAPVFPYGEIEGPWRLAVSVAPAMFSDPWWGAGPDDDAAKLSPLLSGQIATVMLDRPQRIGGWNSVAGSPLPLRPFAPPGTVWWIESADAVPSRQLQLGELTAYGYGLAFISGNGAN